VKRIGREFSFKFLGPGVFSRLIVRLISYTRQHNSKQDPGFSPSYSLVFLLSPPFYLLMRSADERWDVKYGKDQIYLSHSGTSAIATENYKLNKIVVCVWGMVLYFQFKIL
jgi:hypothetical protein